MTSKIKVDNIDKPMQMCLTSVQMKMWKQQLHLGASGDTITLASGASQTGFGRTGTVDWDTTAKTAILQQ